MLERFEVGCSYCGVLQYFGTLADALRYAKGQQTKHTDPKERITVYDRMAHHGQPDLYDPDGQVLHRRESGEMTEQEIDQIAEKVVDKILEESVVSVLDVDGHGLLLHFTEHEILGYARVLNEARAKANPCHCFSYEGRDYCFAKGAIGMLSQEQQVEVCKLPKVYEVKPGLKQRFEKFTEAAKEAKKRIQEIPHGERMGPWLHAMGDELEKRGVQV